MSSLPHWLSLHGNLLAILVTIGVAILVVCCMQCTRCPNCEKDDLFRKRNV